MHVVVWLPELSYRNLSALIKRATTVGLGLYPVHPYYKKRPARPGLLIGFAGLSSAQLGTAIELLVDGFKSVLAERP
jgi:GntR family transcriptional regulator / MocR family aminotransferase